MHSEMSDGKIRKELGEVGCRPIFSHHHGITPESGKHERREGDRVREMGHAYNHNVHMESCVYEHKHD